MDDFTQVYTGSIKWTQRICVCMDLWLNEDTYVYEILKQNYVDKDI